MAIEIRRPFIQLSSLERILHSTSCTRGLWSGGNNLWVQLSTDSGLDARYRGTKKITTRPKTNDARLPKRPRAPPTSSLPPEIVEEDGRLLNPTGTPVRSATRSSHPSSREKAEGRAEVTCEA
jgi:hypothetical protein